MNYKLAYLKQKKLIDELKSFSPDKDIINRIESELSSLEKEEESEDEEDFASQYYGRLQEGREYLMSVASDEVTVEDALEAFGFGRNGLTI